MREIVFDDNSESRSAFEAALSDEVHSAILALSNSYCAYQDVCSSMPPGKRSAVVFGFLHVAYNSLIGALQLLMSGYLAPAGNLMRHFTEGTAMMLLCAERTNGALEKDEKQGMNYPFHQVLSTLAKARTREAIGLDRKEWESFMNVSKFYNAHSHASDLAVSANIMVDTPGMVVLGGQFDSGKLEQYRIAANQIASAAAVLRSLVGLVVHNLDAAIEQP